MVCSCRQVLDGIGPDGDTADYDSWIAAVYYRREGLLKATRVGKRIRYTEENLVHRLSAAGLNPGPWIIHPIFTALKGGSMYGMDHADSPIRAYLLWNTKHFGA
jgi:hypothetical protein